MITDLLRTERLYLRKMTEADSPCLFNIWSNPDVTKFMNIENFSDENQAKEMIDFLNELSAQNKAMRYTIIEAKTNQIIGSCGFNTLDYENIKAEIGYDLDSTFWGLGYGTEAVSCLLEYAFEHLNFIRIEAKVEPENLNSIRVLQKLGFTFEGTLRKSQKSKDRFIDLNIYSKLKTD
ncbi:GNAT family N-acetyltransferase [Peribacillus loiseleuriae]|uniref:GNAT family acetyltransferase n=1 Tax=Peribacillus loiseleuriae TaxID=1679170 RepID=A0A0K9GSD5_9BACI|nr:GNAT family protein [Peribacillus loiseleuriae]KMY49548.1 GNAT family acetyltransferase [Peribacillus loiseleuriae]